MSTIYQAKANEYREDEGLTGGVVIFFNNEVQGWTSELRDPQGWRPGCIAVDTSGNLFVSIGGNEYDGASSWVPKKQIAIQKSEEDFQEAEALANKQGIVDAQKWSFICGFLQRKLAKAYEVQHAS